MELNHDQSQEQSLRLSLVTLGFFALSTLGHWIFGWMTFVNEQQAHQLQPVFGEFVAEIPRDTFENWQSEFLQLLWQVFGLAILFSVGSPQSKEGDERIEEKIDAIFEAVDATNVRKTIAAIDRKHWRH